MNISIIPEYRDLSALYLLSSSSSSESSFHFFRSPLVIHSSISSAIKPVPPTQSLHSDPANQTIESVDHVLTIILCNLWFQGSESEEDYSAFLWTGWTPPPLYRHQFCTWKGSLPVYRQTCTCICVLRCFYSSYHHWSNYYQSANHSRSKRMKN